MYNNQQNVINLFSNISNINEITFRFDSKYYPFKIEDFEEKYIIDSTANNDVKLTHHKPTGNFMAVKYVNIPIRRKKLENDNTAHYLIQEVELHKSLRHSHYVVTFYGLCLHQNKALICMELMDFSLYYFYELIHELNWKVPEDFLGCIVYCILNALADCKAKDIIHRDVKPGNILLNRKGEIKLCDFGVSRILNDSMATTVIGTMRYWPPEHFTQIRQPFDVRADIWSLGMTLAEVTLGGFPLSENDAIHRDFALLQNLILETNMQLLIDQIYINYSSNVKEFVKLCLLERDKRPKYDQLMQTTFYNDYDDLNLPVYMVKLIRIVEDATKVKNTPDNIGKIQLLNNELEAIAIQKNNKKFSPKLLPFGNTWDTCPVTQLHDTYTIYNPIPTTPHQNTIDDETELVIECKGLMECRRIVMSLMKSERFKSTMDRIKEMRPYFFMVNSL